MHTLHRNRTRWFALIAVFLFAFHSLVAASALGTLRVGGNATTTIVCTASGPRVITLDSTSDSQKASPHSGSMPHCCTAGGAMSGAPLLPALLVLAWHVEAAPVAFMTRTADTPVLPQGWLDRTPGRPRGPPLL